MSGFRFKRFVVAHDRCAMKVGTDGVLLGAWCRLPERGALLDIGSGSGLIALMLAQRSFGAQKICAVEIDEDAAIQAKENVEASSWHERIEVVTEDITAFAQSSTQRFSHIVSNPPFYPQGQTLKTAQRATARHTGALNHHQLLNCCESLLEEDGALSLILPTDAGERLLALCSDLNWHCRRLTRVCSKPGGEVIRLLLQLERSEGECEQNTLVIHNEQGGYSDDFIALTHRFYLKMPD